jgi:hypothetical protein
MLAVRLGDIDWTDQLITARGEIAKSGITRHVPIGTTRLKAVLEWQRLDAAGGRKSDSALVISDGSGEPIVTFRRAWVTTVLKADGVQPRWSKYAGWKGLTSECQEAFQRINLALARPPARVRVAVSRAGCAALAGSRSTWSRVDHDN